MWVINDPLSQTHSPTSSDQYYHLKSVVLLVFLMGTDGRTSCVEIVITTDRDWVSPVDQY